MSQLHVTIPDSLRAQAESHALQEGVPLDTFVACALTEKVAALDVSGYLRARAAQGNRADYDAVLAKVPDVEPDEYDRVSPELAALIAQSRSGLGKF